MAEAFAQTTFTLNKIINKKILPDQNKSLLLHPAGKQSSGKFLKKSERESRPLTDPTL